MTTPLTQRASATTTESDLHHLPPRGSTLRCLRPCGRAESLLQEREPTFEEALTRVGGPGSRFWPGQAVSGGGSLEVEAATAVSTERLFGRSVP